MAGKVLIRFVNFANHQTEGLLTFQRRILRAGDRLFKKAFGSVPPAFHLRPAVIGAPESLVRREVRPVIPNVLLAENTGHEKIVVGPNGTRTALPAEAPTTPLPSKGKPNQWIVRGGIIASVVLFAGITFNPFFGPAFIGSFLFSVGAGFSTLGAIGILASNLLLGLPALGSLIYYKLKTRQQPKAPSGPTPAAPEATSLPSPPPPPTALTFTSDAKVTYTVERGPMQGGMAKVYGVKAPDGQIYALKIFDPPEAEWERMDPKTKSECRSRFEREVDIMKELQSKDKRHIIQLIDAGVDKNRRFYVMEHAWGTFSDLLNQTNGKAAPDIALKVVFEAALGLQEAGQYAHRDLKPSNILIIKSPTGEITAKVSDFGLGRLLVEESDLTRTQTRFGTWNYLAPEVIEFGWKAVDARLADIYALGMTLYRALEGKTPVEITNLPTTTQACQELAKALRSGLAQLTRPRTMSEDVFKVIEKMIHPNPKERYQSWDEVIKELRPLLPQTREEETFAERVKEEAPTTVERKPTPEEHLPLVEAGEIKDANEPLPTPIEIIAADEAAPEGEPSSIISVNTQMLEVVDGLTLTDVTRNLFSGDPEKVKEALRAVSGPDFTANPEELLKIIARVNELTADYPDEALTAIISLSQKVS